MDETNETQTTENAAVLETPVETQNQTAETKTPETQETPVVLEAPEKPWKKGPPATIPYERFSEVNNRARLAEARAMELEQRMAAIEAEKQRSSEAPSRTPAKSANAEPSIADYDDLDSYLAARDTWQENRLRSVAAETYESQAQAHARALEERKVVESFASKMEAAKERIPDIQEALQYLKQFDKHIHPRIQEVLFTHDHGPELAYHIASNEDMLRQVINDPVGALVAIGRFRADDIATQPPVPAPSPAAVQASIPRTVKGTTASTGYRDDMSMAEYRKWIASRKR